MTVGAEAGIVYLEGGEDAKERKQPLEAEKARDLILLRPPEGTKPHQHLDFSPSNPFQTSDLQTAVTIDLQSFNLLSLC